MFVSPSLNTNDSGRLTIGGMDAVDLAAQYGTPLYVMDEDLVRQTCRTYQNAMDKYYGGNGMILFASKTFCCKYICRIMKEEGLGLDVVSGGELYTALAADFPADKIYFHGNNKSLSELEFAIDKNVGTIVVDNLCELENIGAIAKVQNKTVDIMFRIKPGVEAHTHDFIRTGQIDSKFGVAFENGEAMAAYKQAAATEQINIVGLHCHIGSQIFDSTPFKEAAKVLLQFTADLKAEIGVEIRQLNLGGGYGIKYTDDDTPIDYDEYIKMISEVVKDECARLNLNMPMVIMEPGRSIVGAAGTTLYTIGAVKEIENIRTYVLVDGGMADNPRPITYDAKYTAIVANKAAAAPDKLVTIAGKCCESGDILIKDIKLPAPQPGDILAIPSTGAYNYSMSSNYNRLPRPPVVMVGGGTSRIAIKRETYEDLIKNDLI